MPNINEDTTLIWSGRLNLCHNPTCLTSFPVRNTPAQVHENLSPNQPVTTRILSYQRVAIFHHKQPLQKPYPPQKDWNLGKKKKLKLRHLYSMNPWTVDYSTNLAQAPITSCRTVFETSHPKTYQTLYHKTTFCTYHTPQSSTKAANSSKGQWEFRHQTQNYHPRTRTVRNGAPLHWPHIRKPKPEALPNARPLTLN